MAEVTNEIFIEEYQKFTGSDRKFAEFLNTTYKPSIPFNAKSVFARRNRLNLETINPKTTGDYEGLRKYIKNFKGKFKPSKIAIAKQFGFKDKGVVTKMNIKKALVDMRGRIYSVPFSMLELA